MPRHLSVFSADARNTPRSVQSYKRNTTESSRSRAPGSPRTHQRTVNAELLDNQQTPNTSRHVKQDQQTSRFIKNGSPNIQVFDPSNAESNLASKNTNRTPASFRHIRNTCTAQDRQKNVHQIHQQTTDTGNKKQIGFTRATFKSRLASPGPDNIQTVSRQN